MLLMKYGQCNDDNSQNLSIDEMMNDLSNVEAEKELL